MIEVNGLILSKLPGQELVTETLGERGLCYKLAWEPCLDLLKYEQYDDILTHPLHEKDRTAQHENLERAAFTHIQKTLANITEEEVEWFTPHLQKLYRVLSSLLAKGQHGTLPFQTPQWLSGDEAEQHAFLDTLTRKDDAGRLVCSMGQHLASIFRSDIEPLSIMLQDNSLSTYYRRNNLMNLGYSLGLPVIGELAHQMPTMNIIELGAGTGGATMPTLRELGKRFAHYDFTDISTGFFENAKEEQKEWANRISKYSPSTSS